MINTKCSNCGISLVRYPKSKIYFCSRRCFAEYRKGWNWNRNIPWNKGKKGVYSDKTKNIMRNKKLGNIATKETRRRMSFSHKGEKTNFWQGGINSLSDMIRKSFEGKIWRENVFQRDNYSCKECGKRGRLHAHHIKPFSAILKEFLASYHQFSPLDDKETLVRLAITYTPFWDTNNGLTLCEECHKNTNSYLKSSINGYKS